MTARRRFVCLTMGCWTWCALALTVGAKESIEVARPSAAQQQDALYTKYCQTQIELSYLSRAKSAVLGVVVSSPEPGVIAIEGTVPNERLRRMLIDDARRVSGLEVRDLLRTGRVPDHYFVDISKDELLEAAMDTVDTLFPEVRKHVKASVDDAGVITLTGEIQSHDIKLQLAKAMKSLPGCQAVVSLLSVTVREEDGSIAIDNDGGRLVAAELPKIPPAPLQDWIQNEARPSIRSMTTKSVAAAADDAPEGELGDRQIREDIQNTLEADPTLATEDIEVDVRDGIVTLTGKLATRDACERAATAVTEVLGVKQVIVKGKPFTIQRRLAPKAQVAKTTEVKEANWATRLMPWTKQDGQENRSGDRKLRASVQKSIKKRCEKRIKNVVVRPGIRGLLIEGEVDSAKDRAFVLKQIDTIAELNAMSYDVILRVGELK